MQENVPPADRREDFPIATFRHLEQGIIVPLRRRAMTLATQHADRRQPGASIFTVGREDIDAGL